ncbi:3-oxoacyl-ACP synthase III family protein [Nocardiopsis terrae]
MNGTADGRVAILDFEVRLPAGRVTVDDIQRLSGLPESGVRAVTHCAEIPVMEKGEAGWEFAADIAETVVERAGTPLDTIGEVIVAGAGEWVPPVWSPAAGIADRLGIRRAHCYEIINFCNASTTGIRAAVDAITHGRAEHVLVVLVDQLSGLVDYTDPDSRSLFNFGESATVLLLGRGDTGFEVLHTTARTDPTWHDFYSGEIFEGRFVMRRRFRRHGAVRAYVDNICDLVGETLTHLGRSLDDVAGLLMNHSNRTTHERVMERLGLPEERSVYNYDRWGHMGSSDPFLALDGLLRDKRVNEGDLFLVVSSGVGFNWGVTAVEYRGQERPGGTRTAAVG